MPVPTKQFSHLRVALVHDWLVVNGGAEKVLESFARAFPQAEIFTLVNTLREGASWLSLHHVHTSFLQRLPFIDRFYRHCLPAMPYAIEQFDLREFDLVITSSHAVAKGVITHPDQIHICYCHTPMRYAWDMKEAYLADASFPIPGAKCYVRKALKHLRQWDYFSSTQVDVFLANSHNVAKRIAKYYRRKAKVLYPPVYTDHFNCYEGHRENYYIAASRLVPYKRMDLIIQTFVQDPQKRSLKVIGDGPEYKHLKKLAEGADHVELVGYLPDDELQYLMQRAKAFIFAADEDFGIVPLEAQACGTPVIAYGKGGALETVKGTEHGPEATGIHFKWQTVDSLKAAVCDFESHTFSPLVCRKQAEAFSQGTFYERLATLIEEGMADVRRNQS